MSERSVWDEIAPADYVEIRVRDRRKRLPLPLPNDIRSVLIEPSKITVTRFLRNETGAIYKAQGADEPATATEEVAW